MILQNYWKLIDPSWSLSAIETRSSKSSSLIFYPDLSSPSFNYAALKVPSRSLSKSLNAFTNSLCSCPFISVFFLKFCVEMKTNKNLVFFR